VRTATKVLTASGLFGAVIAVVYWFVAYEIAGTIFLAAMAASLFFAAAFGAREVREGSPAEDRPLATPGESAGEEVGPFPEGSLWPVFLGAGSLLLVIGLIYGVWVLALGGLISAAALLGMSREGR
jgi:hypothetical protein